MKKIYLMLFLLLVVGCTEQVVEVAECSTDADCVAATCCHASECVPKAEAPDCKRAMCTMDCRPGTLDCGQGGCVCNNGKCDIELYR